MAPTARPPPLRLHIDNMLPNLGLPAYTTNSFFSRVYAADWRNTILALSILNMMTSFFWAQVSFEDEVVDAQAALPNLAYISFVLGVIYSIICMIEIIGIFSVSIRHLMLIRLYFHLSFMTAVLTFVAGTMSTVAYFVFADDVIQECIWLASLGQLESKSTFRARAWKLVAPIPVEDAEKHCTATYELTSPTPILAMFLFYVIPATIYYLMVYTYYCQTTDLSHPANLLQFQGKGRRSAIQMEALANSPLYNAQPTHSPGISRTRPRSLPNSSTTVSPGPPSYRIKPPGRYDGIAEGVFTLGSAGSLTTGGWSSGNGV